MNDNNSLEALLKLTSNKLGTTPEGLKQAAQSGNLDKMLGGAKLSPEQRQALSDPQAAKRLLSTPQAQKLFELLKKQSTGN